MLLIFFCSIIILIAINYSFLHSVWFTESLCGNVKFLSDSQNTVGPGWSCLAAAGTYQYWADQSGTTITAYVLSLWIFANIQTTRL